MPNVFFVTQGQAYPFEKRDGYIWAPKHSVNRKNVSSPYPPRFFWENMTLVKKGDIIIHYAGALNGGISAISQARNDCYESLITPDLKGIATAGIHGVGEWVNEGWRVDCDYVELTHKMSIKSFHEVIIKFRRDRFSAFNSNGGVNQGYIYPLEKEIARAIIVQAVVNSTNSAFSHNFDSKKHQFLVGIKNSLER